MLGSAPSPLQQQLQAARTTIKRSSSSSARPGGVEGAVWSWEADNGEATVTEAKEKRPSTPGKSRQSDRLAPLAPGATLGMKAPVIASSVLGGGVDTASSSAALPSVMRPMTPKTGRWSCPGGSGATASISLAPLPSMSFKAGTGSGAQQQSEECQVLLLEKGDFYRGPGGESKVS